MNRSLVRAILGLTDGLSGSFSLTLEEGDYTLRCDAAPKKTGR